MKSIIVFFAIIMFFNSSYANSNIQFVCENDVELTLEIIESRDGITIIKVDDGEVVWFRVVAAILTTFIPEAVHAICIKVNGDSRTCDVVYAVTSALVGLKGKSIYKALTKKGVTNGKKWIAKKGIKKSEAVVETATYDTAVAFKRVFKAYKNQGCVKWHAVEEERINNYSVSNNPNGCGICMENAPNNLANYSHREYSFNKKYWEKQYDPNSKRYYMTCISYRDSSCSYWLAPNYENCKSLCTYGSWEEDKATSSWVRKCYIKGQEASSCNEIKQDPCLSGCNWGKEKRSRDGKYYSECYSKFDNRTVCDTKIIEPCPTNPSKCTNCYVLSPIQKSDNPYFLIKYPSPIGYGTNKERYTKPSTNSDDVFMKGYKEVTASCDFCYNKNSIFNWEDDGEIIYAGVRYIIQKKTVMTKNEYGIDTKYICSYLFKPSMQSNGYNNRNNIIIQNEHKIPKGYKVEKDKRGRKWLKTVSGVTIGLLEHYLKK